MPAYHPGRRDEPRCELVPGTDLIAVRTRSRRSIALPENPVPTPASAALHDAVPVAEFPNAGVVVYRVPRGGKRGGMDRRKRLLRASADVRFAGGVLVEPETGEPVLYTENLFVKFQDDVDPEEAEVRLRQLGLGIKRPLPYATNAYFVAAPEGTGQRVFDLAQALLDSGQVEFCHPELIRRRVGKQLFPQQWHLLKTTNAQGIPVDAHCEAGAAHLLSQGEGIVIAVIDNGFDVDHLEFSGMGKIVAPRDVTLGIDDPRPKDPAGAGARRGENHGTACAGVACANGVLGASGVAPKARLMPIRLAPALGSIQEAEAFVWAADHGADVISCSWGHPDGFWWEPDDPAHQVVRPLMAGTRLALDYATTRGRGGRGCVVIFAAGNGNESVDNDGYASYPRAIAVAACNDRNVRSAYSDFGRAIWCAFPSDDQPDTKNNRPPPLMPGIWTTDRRGAAGFNTGLVERGDPAGNFTSTFGGTSSSCPGVAGVVALVLAVNPMLRWDEVKELLRRSCDRIDAGGGTYDQSGHSPFYGFGRVNALKAVQQAQPQPQNTLRLDRRFDAPLPDLSTSEFSIDVSETARLRTVGVAVELKHTYISDLVISLLPPPALGLGPVVLHDRAGAATRDLKRVFDTASVAGLTQFAGLSGAGRWVLRIQDVAAQDSGTLISFSLLLTFA